MKYRLGDLVQIKYGKDHKKLNAGNIPVYGTGGLMRRVNDFIYDGDSVLIPRKGSLNNVMYVTNKFWTVDTMFWTKIDKNKILPKYLYYCLSKIDLSTFNVGSAVPSLTIKILNEITLEVPSLQIQNEIISKIKPIEDKIRLNNKINDNLQELRHILYKQLIAQSALKTISIKELYSIKYGKTLPKSQLLRTGTKVFGAKGFMGYTERKPLVNKATVTITSRGSGAGFVSYIDEEEAFLTNNLLYLIDKTGLGLSFTYELIKSSKPSQFVTGSAQPQLTINNLKQLKLKIPTDRFIIEQFKNNTKRIEDCMSNNKIENNSLQKLRLAFLNYYF
ncbi:restriction endonuclease subunit S [Limosilactobacillus reuteri subsp. suis]|uniref:restriction endonuclease subunit S n=1 Tax=Limosilactobacillus reuteri TaxID=1598 RepID=UPI003991A462